ncbi:gluconate 2-dehydrogenase subunit 3 family protein [Naasia lichenicola]|uniref:gluconate 2-dehydrogenase subunit 3 family protein n=1 Tax=Naasia lichenicola TaxID=2565933 RepID=UPI00130EB2E4|nr:gluconate 2-dehydrogenase subunit 3 family protein [Naasia lichenicola]
MTAVSLGFTDSARDALPDLLRADERASLAAVADLLIPHTDQMPSGSEADVQGEFIDRVLSVRPDLLDAVRTGLAQVEEPLPADFAELDARGLSGLRALAEAVTAAYFLNPDVAKLVGYRKRSAIPIRFDEDLDDLVASVTGRGPIYRPTPGLGPSHANS